MNKVTAATVPPVAACECRVLGVTPLSPSTFQVELQSPVDTTLDYHAGQYLRLELDLGNDGHLQHSFYSIANSFNPEMPRRLQLFVQNSSEQAGTVLKHLFELSQYRGLVKVTLPMGAAFLQTNLDLPHLLVAAGSGISSIKCLAEGILKRRPDANLNIYWSNKDPDDFYLLNEFQSWSDQNENTSFTPILESARKNWSGRSGYIYEVIEAGFDDLNDAQVYLCGSPQMVYGTIDKLKYRGLKEANCYSDVFEYAPRDQKIAI